jgi:hypothetical protein
MFRRLSVAVAAAALVLSVGSATALAAPNSGSVNATSTCSDLQDNMISGEVYVYLHTADADGWDVSITYHKSGDTFWSTLTLVDCSDFSGWYLYDTGFSTSEAGATSVAVFDPTGTKVGGDSFLSILA